MKVKKTFDISRNITNSTVVWPGDKKFSLKHTRSFSYGDGVNVSEATIGMHMATHMDAPLHYIEGGKSIDEMDMSYFIGYAKVFEVDAKKLIELEDVENLDIKKDDIILFKTSNSNIEDDVSFEEDYVALSYKAAEFLVDKKVKTIGIDYLSIEAYFFDKDNRVHKLLLSNEIALLEGLNLKEVVAGKYFISCLPLKIVSSEASPVRAVLMEI